VDGVLFGGKADPYVRLRLAPTEEIGLEGHGQEYRLRDISSIMIGNLD
jgi:hypothetical protein